MHRYTYPTEEKANVLFDIGALVIELGNIPNKLRRYDEDIMLFL